MTDLQATLDAIDQVAVQECAHCQRRLDPDGASLDFCDDWCQSCWLAAKQEIVELIGYREPHELPEHAFNLVELSSPETTPAWERPDGIYELALGMTELRLTLRFDTSRLESALGRMAESVRVMSARWEGMSIGHVVIDETRNWQPIGLINQVTVPDVARVFDVPEDLLGGKPFGADFDFEHRPATTLPDELPPAVMTPLPERDWQALVDAHTSSGPERHRRAPRELGRRR